MRSDEAILAHHYQARDAAGWVVAGGGCFVALQTDLAPRNDGHQLHGRQGTWGDR